MPRGKEHEAPKILAEDIDKVAADKLRDVVANMATVNEEVGGLSFTTVSCGRRLWRTGRLQER